MSRVREFTRRVDTIHRQVFVKRSWAFILLDDATIPAEQRAMIRPGDPVYIKRVIVRDDLK